MIDNADNNPHFVVMRMTQKILALSDTYCAATGRSRARVSTLVFNRGGKLAAIAGGAGLTTDSYENALAWFVEHWPRGVPWPEFMGRG